MVRGELGTSGWSGKKLNLMGYAGPITLSLENPDNSTDVVLSRRLYNQVYFGLAHRHLPKTPDMLDVKDIDPLLRYALG